MKTKFTLLSILMFLWHQNVASQCTPGAVNPSVWGTPTDFMLGFTADADINDQDTLQVVQGEDTTIVMQYLLPKKQSITSPISGTATVTSVQVQGVANMPIGLSWTLDAAASANNNTYNPQNYRFGSVTVCGTTFASPGIKTLNVSALGCGTLSGISDCSSQTFQLYIEVLPGQGGNSAFTITPPLGCNSMDVDFEAIFQSPDPVLFPVDFAWDFGDGTTATGTTVSAHNYSSPGIYPVKLDVTVNKFVITNVFLSASGGWWGDIEEWGSGMSPELYGTLEGISLPEQGSGNSQNWTTNIPITSNSVSCQFYDADNGPPFGSQDDDLGVGTNNSFVPVDGGTISVSTSNYAAIFTLQKQVDQVLTFWDTVKVFPSSVATATSSNGTSFCNGDSTILDIGTGFDAVQWYNDTTLLPGETNTTLVVKQSGNYSAKVVETGSICEGQSNSINIMVDVVSTPVISSPSTGTLEVNNPNGYTIQWFSNGVPIPGATSEQLTDLSSGNPFSVVFTNTNGCTAKSVDYNATILQAGTSTQSGNTLDNDTPIDFTASGFSLCAGQDIAWAVSTQADGAITDMTGLQTAIDNGWIYPSSGPNALNLNCGNASFPQGDYFMTPVSVEALNIEPVYWNSNTDSGYCDAKMEVCFELTGTDYAINPLTITLPNGNVIDVLDELAGLGGTAITPQLWQIALNQAGGGSSLCLDLIDLLGYYENPNGTWAINATNTGTGNATLAVADFNITVLSSNCDSLAADQITPIQGFSETIAPGAVGSFSLTIPPVPTSFPTIDANCLLFGDATEFTSMCATPVNAVSNVENLVVYPNPNNGIFTLEFETNATENVIINIVDITGRIVLNRSYPNINGLFREQFDLKNNLNDGFYVIDINVSGVHQQQKIIIK